MALTEKVRDLFQKDDVYAYFKCEDTAEGAVYAEALLSAANPQR